MFYEQPNGSMEFANKQTTLNFLIYPVRLTLKQQSLLVITMIACAQFLLHLGAMGKYGFHQDELLYLALSKHLALGYKETPPFIALVGWLGKTVFGDTLVATRLIPAICAGAIVHLTGLVTMRLGGKLFAITIACIGVGFSSAFLATGALFIPQVFDELFWLLTAYFLIRYVQQPHDRHLYGLGVIIGIGLLVKYTFLIYLIGILIGLGFSDHRTIFKKRAFWMALGISLLIFLPHLYWQYQMGFPAVAHYQELKSTQLVYLDRWDFLLQQLAVNGTGIVIWPMGIYLLVKAGLCRYRFLAIGFFGAMSVLFILNGKPYYAFGAFPPLFAAGAIYFEKRFQKIRTMLKLSFLALLLIPNLLLAVIVLPYLPIQQAAKVFEWTYINLNMHFPLKWEDQKIHNMNQNYADMIGWDELAQKTSALYRSLPPAVRRQTVILADNYGEAGAIDHYREVYPLPRVISLSSSYALWAPQQLPEKNIIYISTKFGLPHRPEKNVWRYGEISNPFSRVYGMDIYLIKNVDSQIKSWYHEAWKKSNRQSSLKQLASTFVLKDGRNFWRD